MAPIDSSASAQNTAASSAESRPNASARRSSRVRMPAASARSSARDSSVQARGVENGTGSAGTGRISASGM